MRHSIWSYILVMGLTTYMIRVLPLTLIRKPIQSKLIRSFLYYVPYVTLAVMTFPAIITVTDNMWSGAAALAVGLIVAWVNGDLFVVAISCCATVFLTGFVF